MPTHTRPHTSGGTVFFTVTLADPRNTLLTDHICLLRDAVREVHFDHPFGIAAWVVLPNHMHAVWDMPDGDTAYGQRWGAIKSKFTRALRRNGVVSRHELLCAKETVGHAGIWLPRFKEHEIKTTAERDHLIRYCWSNPVRHGLVAHAHDWTYSSIHRDHPGQTTIASRSNDTVTYRRSASLVRSLSQGSPVWARAAPQHPPKSGSVRLGHV